MNEDAVHILSSNGDLGQPESVIKVTDPFTDRYNSFGFISWWKQEKVRLASVLVVGAGALGNEVLKNLALMGIGRILIVDYDRIEMSNLSRSVLFRTSDEGGLKAAVAAKAIKDMNPDIAVKWLNCDINYELGLGVYRRMDLIIGCLDNREARLTINKASWKLGKPWIDGAIQELLGISRVFIPGNGACYECTLTDEDYKIMSIRMSCNRLANQNIIEGKVPTTPTIASIIGATQTQDALKLIHGMEVSAGKALVFNGINNDVYTTEYPIKSDCLSHERWEKITELPSATAKTTTGKELLEIAQDLLGPDAYCEIPAFAVEAVCPVCSKKTELMKPLYGVSFEDSHCASCGGLLSIKIMDRISIESPLITLEQTLSFLGIPPLEIIRAQTPDWRNKFLELTGDATDFSF